MSKLMFRNVRIRIVLLIEFFCFSLEQHHAESLRGEKRRQEDNADKDKQNPVDPPPLTGLVRDPAPEQGS